MAVFKIRHRERICSSPKAGLRQSWDEWQVVEGRKVVGRFDLREQAERWIEAQSQRRQDAEHAASMRSGNDE
jgi:hypothetical protein